MKYEKVKLSSFFSDKRRVIVRLIAVFVGIALLLLIIVKFGL